MESLLHQWLALELRKLTKQPTDKGTPRTVPPETYAENLVIGFFQVGKTMGKVGIFGNERGAR